MFTEIFIIHIYSPSRKASFFSSSSQIAGTCQDMFPINSTTNHEKYHETFAETDRLKNATIP